MPSSGAGALSDRSPDLLYPPTQKPCGRPSYVRFIRGFPGCSGGGLSTSLHGEDAVCLDATVPAVLHTIANSVLAMQRRGESAPRDRKSTRLNSTHAKTSYTVTCSETNSRTTKS